MNNPLLGTTQSLVNIIHGFASTYADLCLGAMIIYMQVCKGTSLQSMHMTPVFPSSWCPVSAQFLSHTALSQSYHGETEENKEKDPNQTRVEPGENEAGDECSENPEHNQS